MSDRRDDEVQQHVGPFFVLLYRGLDALPRITVPAYRGVRVTPDAQAERTLRQRRSRVGGKTAVPLFCLFVLFTWRNECERVRGERRRVCVHVWQPGMRLREQGYNSRGPPMPPWKVRKQG